VQATTEVELKILMVAGLAGEAAAHRTPLDRLSGHLRPYFKGRLAGIGRSGTEAEDLVQEALRRHTYDQTEPLTPWACDSPHMASRAMKSRSTANRFRRPRSAHCSISRAGAAAFTLVPGHEMLATSDCTLKLVAPAVGDRFVGRGRGRVIARTGATTISHADVLRGERQRRDDDSHGIGIDVSSKTFASMSVPRR
jgi:hypothetical protein